jgi:PTS system beta-glucosides-specific IIC component
MAKGNLAENILYNIGGCENIEKINHCATRLRIHLRDQSKINIPNIEGEKGVIRVVTNGDQLQIIIGSHVTQVYDAINKLYLNDVANKNNYPNVKKQRIRTKKPMTVLKNCSAALSATMTPLIGPLIAAGLIKGLLALAFNSGLISLTPGPFFVLYHLNNVILFFLPFFIAYTASLAFGGSTALMLTVVASLFFMPVGIQKIDEIPFGEGINILTYSATVFPVLLCIFFSATAERVIKKIITNSASFMLVPLLTLLIAIPLSTGFIAPAGLWLGQKIAVYYHAGYQVSPVLVCMLFAGVWQLSVLIGLHWIFALVMLNTLLIDGYDTALPLLIPAVLGQAGASMAVLTVNIARRKQQKKGEISSVLSAILGLTEPVIYQTNLPLRYPFVIGCLSAALGGIVYGLYQIKMYSFGILGVLSLLQTETIGTSGYIAYGLLGGVIAFITSFLMTLLYRLIKKTDN